MKKKKKKISNIIFNIIGLISLIVAIVFVIYVFNLNMLPSKYMNLFIIVLGIIYVILFLFTVPPRIKNKFKAICSVFFILFAFLFGFGIKYVDKTISFIDKINDDLSQKEEYYLITLANSDYNSINDFNSSKVGVYLTPATENSVKASKKLEEKIKFEIVEYDDIVEMFDDLTEDKTNALLVNESIIRLLDEDLSYLNVKIKTIDSVLVPIKSSDIVKVVDVTTTPFNIYISGSDSYGSIGKISNSDVNIVATIDPVHNRILLTSIPRDYYVDLYGFETSAWDKLTHAGYYGIETQVKTIEQLLDTEINYYVRVNFSTAIKLIDAIGGVDVNVDYAFTTDDNYYSFNAGYNYMDGAKALRFIRERKNLKGGDLARQINQQKVISAIIDKFTTSTVLISKYSDILGSLNECFQTNIDSSAISKLIKYQLNKMPNWTIDSYSLSGTDFYTETFSYPGQELYVMKRNNAIVEEAKSNINKIMIGS